MGCLSAYAKISDFVSFWCVGSVITGQHTGPNDLAALTDSVKNFPALGVRPGFFLSNVDDGSYTSVELVQTNTLQGALYGGTDNMWETGDKYQAMSITLPDALGIENMLALSSADVTIALESSGQCDCTFSEASMNYLMKLTVTIAALVHNCPCGGLNNRWSDAIKLSWLEWMERQLNAISSGDIVLCQGETGKKYPAMDTVPMGFTDRDIATLVYNRRLRD